MNEGGRALSSHDQTSWPPRDPTIRPPETEFVLPSSPWTFENGSVNPILEPSNTHIRESKRRRTRPEAGAYSLPPYHPDYQEEGNEVVDDSSSDATFEENEGRVRRGSEGYEVQSVDREGLLARYLKELGEEPQRYHRYIPEPASDSEESEDDLVLAHAIQKNR